MIVTSLPPSLNGLDASQFFREKAGRHLIRKFVKLFYRDGGKSICEINCYINLLMTIG
jgi:hypothetical protein